MLIVRGNPAAFAFASGVVYWTYQSTVISETARLPRRLTAPRNDINFKCMSSKLHFLQSAAIAVGIVIVFNLFVNFGVRTFYPAPKFEQYCAPELGTKAYESRTVCEAAHGLWYETGAYPKGGPYPARPMIYPDQQPEMQGWCDIYHTCNQQFNTVQEMYNRNVFIILVIAGIIALILGSFIRSAAAVSSGFIFGGIVSLIVGSVRYWSNMHDYLRFIILGVALAALVIIGYMKLRKQRE